MVVFGQRRLYSEKVAVFAQSGCNRAKVVVFEQKLLLSGKSGNIRAKWLYSGKLFYSIKSGCILAKCFY